MARRLRRRRLVWKEKVILSPGYIERVGLFMRHRIAWQEIASVAFRGHRQLLVTSMNDVEVVVSAYRTGVADLPDLLDRYLPAEVHQASEADLERYRRFLGVRTRGDGT